ncbi:MULTISPECIES: DUF4271 domain-containing protein [unclassified Capnocytophaga]|jgi:hypothetical protein|uniref:DUF4271 domain-containing protein n=1 Tax=unclassified Capnocytophaga TaxID=2640652 RepID=UPI000202CBF1|nr:MULTISPECIES: DUF4271 domain-containing protein [unclassified Capnocytophaga]EGD33945.1 membrane protein [Capnocytophaga sp. oral taxon 338 str. F0234]MEB3004296.1 DUF4271 domain-containing protein [Capnocytophaga sp. G2]
MKWTPVVSNNIDWISFVFIAILAIIAFIKTYHSFRFREFLNLLFNNKYIIIFNKKEKTNVLFTSSLLGIQWLVLSITIWLLMRYFLIDFSFYSIPLPYIIMVGVAAFLLLKITFQRFISYVFDFDLFSRSYLFIRLSYSNYASFILVFLLFFDIYGMNNNIYLLGFSLITFLYIQILGLVSFVKLYKNEIRHYWYYFILYLCTVEIVPYIFIKHWIINSSSIS